LKVPPDACIVFEDSLVGLEAARHAGMRAVGVTTAHSETELREAGAERAIADFEGLEWTSLASP
ncbi:MAG: HAD family phosphatase, partial [Candidatus Rokubacteria bacterium]|nr:HAD family phosphatase [Candidatus Rokubacteria bacterium]